MMILSIILYFKVSVVDDKMRLHITTDTRTLTIDCDEEVTDVHITKSRDVPHVVDPILFEQQESRSIEETARILEERGLGNNGSSLGIDAYMGLERLLIRCGPEIPFIENYTIGHVCNIVDNITPVVSKGTEKYYWDESKSCGFKYNRKRRGWTYFLPPNISSFLL